MKRLQGWSRFGSTFFSVWASLQGNISKTWECFFMHTDELAWKQDQVQHHVQILRKRFNLPTNYIACILKRFQVFFPGKRDDHILAITSCTINYRITIVSISGISWSQNHCIPDIENEWPNIGNYQEALHLITTWSYHFCVQCNLNNLPLAN